MFDLSAFESACSLGFYEQECSYLPGRMALYHYAYCPEPSDYRYLMDAGYRRAGKIAYRMACENCKECRVIRLAVKDFQPTKSQRRVWNKSKDFFTVKLSIPSQTDEKVQIYSEYLKYQHQKEFEGDYSSFFVDSFLPHTFDKTATNECCLYYKDCLAGLGIVDRVGDVLSSVYFYFHPDFADRSPGVFSVLAEIRLAEILGLTYYYPGFYIKDCPAMNYKANYGPHEIFTPPLLP